MLHVFSRKRVFLRFLTGGLALALISFSTIASLTNSHRSGSGPTVSSRVKADWLQRKLPDAATANWTRTASLNMGRGDHTATLLPNGKVLVAGGQGNSGVLASAELYDPVAYTWTNTGSLAAARYGHTATLLANGKVLVAGGFHFSNILNSAEL